jgi:hypothetical protein
LAVWLAVLAVVIVAPAGEAEADSASNDDGFLAGSYFALRLAASEADADGGDWESLKQYYLHKSQGAASMVGSGTGVTAASDDHRFLAGSYYSLREAEQSSSGGESVARYRINPSGTLGPASAAGSSAGDGQSVARYRIDPSGTLGSASTAGSEAGATAASDDRGFRAGGDSAMRLASSEPGLSSSDGESVARYRIDPSGTLGSASTASVAAGTRPDNVFAGAKDAGVAASDAKVSAIAAGTRPDNVFAGPGDTGAAVYAPSLNATRSSEALGVSCRSHDNLVLGVGSGSDVGLEFYGGDC